MNAFSRVRATAVGAAVTFGLIALCVGATSALGSSRHRERLPVQLLNSFPLSPGGQAVPRGTKHSAGPRSRRSGPVRLSPGRRPIAAPGVPAILIAVVAAVVSLLALGGVLAAARLRSRGQAVRLPFLSGGAPATMRFSRLRYADPQRIRERGGAGDAAFGAAMLLEDQGDLRGAAEAYWDAAKSGHVAAELNLGVLLHHRGEFEVAEQQYRRALERGEPAGAFNLGVLLEEQRDIAGARSAYRRADRRGHAAAACNLGVLLEENGLLALAHAAYSRADERGDPKGAVNLGMMLEEQGDLEAAQGAYRRAGEYRHATEAASAGEASRAPRASA